jgi:hypothetical protein
MIDEVGRAATAAQLARNEKGLVAPFFITLYSLEKHQNL